MSEPPAIDEATPHSPPVKDRSTFSCLNCGAENVGEFCSHCGQKNVHAGDLSLRHAWHHLIHELLHLDGKIFRTFWVLISKPGQLTLDFLQGRRARHIHPIRLFIVIGAIYFSFAQMVLSPMDLRARYDRNLNPAAVRNLERAIANTGLTVDEFFREADARVAPLFKSVYVSSVLLNGILLWLLFRRRYACMAEHLVLALHFASFVMTLWIVVSPAHFFGVSRLVIGFTALPIWLGYFLVASRRVYAASWGRLVGAWLLVMFSQGLVLATMGEVVMRRVLVAAPSFVTVRPVTAVGSDVVITPKTKIPLFSGESIAGWIFVGPQATAEVSSVWSVAQGEIHCTGTPSGYLRTSGRYRDYVLRFEWRWLGQPGNSGVFVHVSEPDRIWPACLEVQLRSGDAGSLRTNGGVLVQEVRPPAPNPRQVNRRVDGIEKPPGEWNVAEVICRGDRVTITINGVVQNEVTQSTVIEGSIALQSEGARIAFRNLELMPLPPP